MQDNQNAETSKDKVQKEKKRMKNFPDDVFVIFHWLNSSGRTRALGRLSL